MANNDMLLQGCKLGQLWMHIKCQSNRWNIKFQAKKYSKYVILDYRCDNTKYFTKTFSFILSIPPASKKSMAFSEIENHQHGRYDYCLRWLLLFKAVKGFTEFFLQQKTEQHLQYMIDPMISSDSSYIIFFSLFFKLDLETGAMKYVE